MLLSYYVTDVKSLIALDIYTGRCYCHVISGRCCPLCSSVADVISHCGRWNCQLNLYYVYFDGWCHCQRESMMWVIMGLSRGTLFLNNWVEVEDGIEDKVPHNCWDTSGGFPFSGGGSFSWESEGNSHHSTMMRGSREGNQAGRAGRGLRVKVHLLIFKDEKIKDPVTYCSWQWDVAIFCCLGWDDQHLLLYIFQSLKGFSGELARSLGKDATPTNVLQMMDEHYGMVMMFIALSKELYSFKQGSRENVAEFGVCLLQQVQIL